MLNLPYSVYRHVIISLAQVTAIFTFFVHLWLQNEAYRAKLKKSNERSLALVKAAMDTVVAIGLLQLAPKKITPRVTGALGFTTSLISCYQVSVPLFSMLSIFMCA